MKPVRTRFAPSPTGYLHVGGVRTALFAWLLARQNQGKFILRFEDTDKQREVVGAAEHIIKSLKALGLEYDEGPDIGGQFGPYTQSERLDHYKQWARKLIDSGRAYADPYNPDEVHAFRQAAQSAKQPFLYRNHRPDNPPAWDGSQPLRFKSEPAAGSWKDAVMGERSFGPETIDDFILIKSDGYPTYNFAHIVDDSEMEISHVMRGQEFLPSIPNYLNLYSALNLEPPVLATLPHILNLEGNKKLSKRDGAKDVLEYIDNGFLPDALVNFIASLGWNDGSEQEIFTRAELVSKFSLDHIQRSGAHFDERRLEWMNGSWIRNLSLDELFKQTEHFWPPEAESTDDEYKQKVLGLVQERLKFFAELPELTKFFFVDLPVDPKLISEHKQLKKLSREELHSLLSKTLENLAGSDFSLDDLTTRLNKLLEDSGQKPAVLFSLIRIATTQAAASPGLADTMAVLGKSRSLTRIDRQLAALS